MKTTRLPNQPWAEVTDREIAAACRDGWPSSFHLSQMGQPTKPPDSANATARLLASQRIGHHPKISRHRTRMATMPHGDHVSLQVKGLSRGGLPTSSDLTIRDPANWT